jgi:iron(III) transport system substrate-binding protein
MRRRVASALIVACVLGCARSESEVVVYTSVDQVFSEPILRSFEQSSGVRVRVVFDTEETKSTGVLNRIIAEAAHPQADVFWSGDPVRPFVLIQRDLVEPYASPEAARIPSAFKDPAGRWTGFAARARVLLVNRERLGTRSTPTSIRDLARPEWKDETAIANPLFGTTTMHVAALAAAWGEDEMHRFLDALRANGARVASSNGEVKRLVVSGQVTIGLTDTDDAHEAVQSGADVIVVYPDQQGDGTLLMPTSVVVLRGVRHPEPARRLVDHLLSPATERRLAEVAAHMPLRRDVHPPDGVRSASDLRVMAVDYGKVAALMESIQPWLRGWAGF